MKIIKSDVVAVLIFFAATTILFFSLFKSGIYFSHDGEVHIARLAQFSQALKEGQFPVRWLPNWNFAYGYPAFVYVYSLPYYLGSPFLSFNLNYEQVFKVLIYLSVFFSAISFYIVAKSYFSNTSAIVGAIFYIAAPYRFADIYERGALGESLVFVFLPLFFLAPKLFQKNIGPPLILLAFVTFLSLTTHLLTFLVFLPFILIFYFLQIKNVKIFANIVLSIFTGFLLSAFQTLPSIFEQNFVDLDKTYWNIFEGHLITVNQLLRIPKDGIPIGTGIQLGTAQTTITAFALLFLIYKFLKNKKVDKIASFLLLSSILAAFLSLNLSASIWHSFFPLKTILFPWRFLAFTTFATSLLASYLIFQFEEKKFAKLLIFVFLFFAIFPSRHFFITHKNFYTFEPGYYLEYQDHLKLDNYFLPKNLTSNIYLFQLLDISFIKGEGVISAQTKKSDRINLSLYAARDSTLQFHTMYFPGWRAKIDKQSSPLVVNSPNLNGLMALEIPSGNHDLEIYFTETPFRRLSDIISLVSFLPLFIFGLIHLKKVRSK